MERSIVARNYMGTKYNCAQSIIKAYSEEIGFTEDQLIHVVFPFGGGFGRNGFVCGAISGAAMILGGKYGKILSKDNRYREKMYRITNLLTDRFKKYHGSYICKELIHLDLSNPEELKKAQDSGVFTSKCPIFVQQAAEILEELLKIDPSLI